MSISVAELVANLRVASNIKEVKDFHGELKSTAATTQGGFRKGVKVGAVAVAALGAAALATAGYLVHMTGEVTAQADEIAKGARAAGIGAEEYQRLSHAAQLAGTDAKSFTKSVRRLNIEVEKAAMGTGTPDFTKALAELGLTLTDVQGKSAAEQLGIFADAMGGIEDPARKSALAALIFGERSGPQMASLMAEGSAGIQSLMGELDNVYSDEQLSKAEEYQDSMTELGDRVDQAKTEIVFALVPALLDATNGMEGWIGENESFIKQDLPNAMGEVVKGVIEVVKFFGEAAVETKALSMQLKQLDEDTGALTTAWQIMSAPFRAVATVMEETYGVIKKIVEEVATFLGLSKELEAFAAKYGLGPDTPRVATRGAPKFGDPEQQAKREAKEQAARVHALEAATDAANAAAATSIAGFYLNKSATSERVRRAKRAGRKKGKGKKQATSKDVSLEDLINAATGDGTIDSDLPLDEIAKRAPTVVVQITNNKVDLHFNPQFPNVHDPDQAAARSAQMVAEKIQEVFDQTGQRIAPVRIR